MDLLPLQVFRKSCWGYRLGYQTYLIRLISFLDQKYISSSSLKPSFVDCWLVCIIIIASLFIDPKTFPRVCSQFLVGCIQKGHTNFYFPAGLYKVVARVSVFVISPVVINALIDFKSVNQVGNCIFIYITHRRLLRFWCSR